MRTLKGILFLICCFYISFAQTNVYHPFPDSGMVWNMRISGSECSSCYKRSYFISGDTVINAITCRKIEYNEITGISMPPWYHCDYSFNLSFMSFYGGALHEDTALKKVYLFLPGSSTDTLLYDFSLGIGDTIPYGINNNYQNPILYVDQIDSVLIGTTYRKRFHLGNTVTDGLIEGIGSTTGLLDDLFVFECGGYLECVSQNGQVIYPYPNYPCDFIDGVNEFSQDALGSTLNVFPNPVTENLTIYSPQLQIDHIEIYNFIGERYYSSAVNSESCPPLPGYGGQCILNCASLPPGIYFVLATSGGRIFYKKFIKE